MGRSSEVSQAEMLPSESPETLRVEVRRNVGQTGVSGEGPVALLEFKAIGSGNLQFALEDCELNNGQGLSSSCSAIPLTIEME
jgi:hypothetical protein